MAAGGEREREEGKRESKGGRRGTVRADNFFREFSR